MFCICMIVVLGGFVKNYIIMVLKFSLLVIMWKMCFFGFCKKDKVEIGVCYDRFMENLIIYIKLF